MSATDIIVLNLIFPYHHRFPVVARMSVELNPSTRKLSPQPAM